MSLCLSPHSHLGLTQNHPFEEPPETGHIPHKSDIDADDWRIASQTSGAGKSDRKKVPATLPLKNFGEVFRSKKSCSTSRVLFNRRYNQQEMENPPEVGDGH